jgi:hypothetical protein
MRKTHHTETSKPQIKPIGRYLVEAGIVTSAQVEIALNEQKHSGRRLGEILVSHGWVEQPTIEYLMEKVVLPERETFPEKRLEQHKTTNQKLMAVEQSNQPELGGSELLPLSDVASHSIEMYLSPRKTFRFLLLVVIGLMVSGLVGQITHYFALDYPLNYTLTQLFNVDIEQSIPTLYSWSALLLCSILLAIITYAKKVARNRYVPHWGALSIIFLYLSLDEALSLHEKTMEPLRSALKVSGFLYFTWVIPGAIFVIICLLSFLPFLIHLPAKTRRLFFLAGTIFVTGALGMEMVGGYYSSSYGEENMIYQIIVTIEEFLEMLGVIVFIYALLSYMSFNMKGVELKVHITNDRKLRRIPQFPDV